MVERWLTFAIAIGVTGSSRWAILSVSVFFVAGAGLLAFVREPRSP